MKKRTSKMSDFRLVLRWKRNETNRALGHFCAHIGSIGPGKPPEDGDMSEMTLPSRHMI